MNTPQATSPQAVILNEDIPPGCIREQDTSIYQVCVPPTWDGVGLVIYAHGYVSPYEPLHLPSEADHALGPGETYDLSLLVNSLNFAFAVTSYPYNGLVRPADAIEDFENLINYFEINYPSPALVFLTGASEGGLHTTLAVEQRPDLFQGGLATCGPYGDFSKQINYFGDVRVLFDYFFPNVLPGNPLLIPQALIEKWEEKYEQDVADAMMADLDATAQFLNVTGLPVPPNPSFVVPTVLDVLWYNVFATNDAIEKLGGQPYDNMGVYYTGSDDDDLLNQKVKRFEAKKKAIEEIEAHYQTTGSLTSPLVMMHTDGDHIVPFFHLELYGTKALGQPFLGIPITDIAGPRFGHCTFTATELVNGFTALRGFFP